VIGASMGGMIAQISAKYPEKVEIRFMFTSNNQPFLPPPFPNNF
jgi:homoserine acetyltransferase